MTGIRPAAADTAVAASALRSSIVNRAGSPVVPATTTPWLPDWIWKFTSDS